MRAYTYTVNFVLNGIYEEEQEIEVVAGNKEDAYDKAVFETIPAEYGKTPWGAYVARVTYSNGSSKRFNTCYGIPY